MVVLILLLTDKADEYIKKKTGDFACFFLLINNAQVCL